MVLGLNLTSILTSKVRRLSARASSSERLVRSSSSRTSRDTALYTPERVSSNWLSACVNASLGSLSSLNACRMPSVVMFLAPDSTSRLTSSGMRRSTDRRSGGSLGGGGLLTQTSYLAVVLTSNVASLACDPNASPFQVDYRNSEPRHLPSTSIAASSASKPQDPKPDTQSEWTTHLEYCDDGYRPTSEVDLDLLRLGALCGASNGLTRGRRHVDELAADAVELELSELQRKCGRVLVAVAVPTAKPELNPTSHQFRVLVESGGKLLTSCQLEGAGWCPEREVLCGGPFKVRVETTEAIAGASKVGLEVWHRSMSERGGASEDPKR